MSLLDQRVFPHGDPRAVQLLGAMMELYSRQTPTRQLAVRAGIAEATINWEQGMADVWPDLLEEAAGSGRLRKLVEAAAADPSSRATPLLLGLLGEAPASPYAGPQTDPFRSGLINSGQRAFLNQHSLRGRLRDMVDNSGRRVLAVEGGPRTGRTFTWFLIHHVLDSQGIAPCRIRLSEYTEPVRVTELAELFNHRFRDWNVAVDSHASEDRQADGLVRQLKGRMSHEKLSRTTQPRYWLVFDDSESVRFTEPALRVLSGLVKAVVEEEMADRLRIILLAHDGWLPDDLEWDVATEHLEPIGVEDLRAFFHNVAEEAGRPIDAETAELLVVKVLSETGHTCLPDEPLHLTERLQRTAAGLGRDLFQGR